MDTITKKEKVAYLNSLELLIVLLREKTKIFNQNKLFSVFFKTMCLSLNDIITSGEMNNDLENFIKTKKLIVINYALLMETNFDKELIKTETGYFIADFYFNEIYFIKEVNELSSKRYVINAFYLENNKIRYKKYTTLSLDDLEDKKLKLLPNFNNLKVN